MGRYAYVWHGRIQLTVEVYLLEVDRVEDAWDEMDFRSRRWCTAEEALELLADHPARAVVVRALAIIARRSVY